MEDAGSFPPLGLLHLATLVVKEGKHKIKLIDACLDNLSYSQIEDIVRKETPEIVGISWNTEYLGDGYLTARAVKKAGKDIKVIVGGPHVFLYPIETINIPEVDYAVRGEADIVFKEILDRLSENKSIDDLPGVLVKGKNYQVLPNVIVDEPDKLPVPDRKLTDYKRYFSLIARGKPITTIMSSRGCCFNCPFCPAGGTKIRDRSVKLVLDEIEQCLALGIKDILFFDELFTFNKKRVLEISKGIYERNLKFRWNIRARIQTMDKEMVDAMAKAGCTLIQFGIESGTDRVQKLLGKNIALDKIREVVKMTQDAGILTYGNFMIGSPTETKEEINKTIEFAKELKLDFAVFAITKLLPGTGFYKDAMAKGHVKEDFWQRYAADPTYKIESTYCPGDFSKQELESISYHAYKSFYSRPAYIFNNYFKHIFTLRLLKDQLLAGLKLLFKL
ncbi:MAG: B12-binding domain-containing radical SAM protein [Elusimicrobia bacterium]|nr:B12-binding domain-containing radical SAM protein [Candidatus Liberimonas magnetica]